METVAYKLLTAMQGSASRIMCATKPENRRAVLMSNEKVYTFFMGNTDEDAPSLMNNSKLFYPWGAERMRSCGSLILPKKYSNIHVY